MDKSKLSAIKKNFKKKAAERKLNVVIARDLLSITFKKSAKLNYEVKISAGSSQNVLSLHYEYYFLNVELYFFAIEHYWIPFAKEAGYDALSLHGYNDELRSTLTALGFCSSKDSPLTSSWSTYVNQSHSFNNEILVLNEVRFKKTVDYIEGLAQFFNDFKTEHPSSTFRLSIYSHVIEFDFYYEGANGTVQCTILNGNLQLTIDQTTLFANSVEEMETVLRSYFESIEHTMRIKNIFHYPTKHFDIYMRGFCSFLKKDSRTTILEALRRKNNPKAVEDYFSTCTEPPLQISYPVDAEGKVRLLSMMNCLFLFDGEHEIYTFERNELKKAEAKLKLLIEEHVTRKVTETFEE